MSPAAFYLMINYRSGNSASELRFAEFSNELNPDFNLLFSYNTTLLGNTTMHIVHTNEQECKLV